MSRRKRLADPGDDDDLGQRHDPRTEREHHDRRPPSVDVGGRGHGRGAVVSWATMPSSTTVGEQQRWRDEQAGASHHHDAARAPPGAGSGASMSSVRAARPGRPPRGRARRPRPRRLRATSPSARPPSSDGPVGARPAPRGRRRWWPSRLVVGALGHHPPVRRAAPPGRPGRWWPGRWAMTMVVRPTITSAQRVADLVLLGGVDRRGGVVEDEHPGIGQDGPGDGEALALATRQREAPLADLGVVAVGRARR